MSLFYSRKNIICLIEIFYILSFLSITYTYNINIAFSILVLFFMIAQKNKYNILIPLILILLLCVPYFILNDFRSVYRAIKTSIVFMPLFFLPVLRFTDYKISEVFHWFMFINASIVYIDFILYFAIGKTIGNFTSTGIFPRPCGLIEDSNFYCYLTIIYLFFLKYTDNQINKFYVISVFLSGSISAIITFFFLRFIYKINNNMNFEWKKWGLVGLFIFFIYIIILLNASNIILFIQELDAAPFIKLKLHSMMLRLTVQSDAINYIIEHGLIFGAGAGETLNIIGRGINLHNGYLQLLFEMGPILFFICIYFIFLCLKNLGSKFFVPLFFCLFLLGNILEVIYFPLLSFILFLSYAKN